MQAVLYLKNMNFVYETLLESIFIPIYVCEIIFVIILDQALCSHLFNVK